MKKTIVGILVSATVLSTCISAFAEGTTYENVYNGYDNKYVVTDDSAYETVYIERIKERIKDLDGEEIEPEIVYIDQENGGFDDITSFMIKDGAKQGYYKATFGGRNSATTKTVNFIIGEVKFAPEDVMTVADEAVAYGTNSGTTYYKKGFKLNTTKDISGFKSIKLIRNGKCIGAFENDLGTSTADTINTIGLMIYGIPENEADFEVCFSTEEVGKRGGN